MKDATEIGRGLQDLIYAALGIDKPATAFVGERVREILLRTDQVCAICGLSSATLYRRINDGSFPAPYAVGSLSTWKLTEVEKWMETLPRVELGSISCPSPTEGSKAPNGP